MNYRALIIGIAGIVALATVGAYAVIVTIFGDVEDEIDIEVGDAFIERYFAPELIHGGLPDIDD